MHKELEDQKDNEIISFKKKYQTKEDESFINRMEES